MAISANLGFPRIGTDRELKKALEAYWSGRTDPASLQETARQLRALHWTLQRDLGIDHIPSNDFSLYDHVLDTTCMLGAVPSRFGLKKTFVDLDTYFAMARGTDNTHAMEMTKWFDTNYHYMVPEFESGQEFRLASSKIIDEFLEAKGQGIVTRPVLLGPVSYLLLGKSKSPRLEPLDLLDQTLPVYAEVIRQLESAGAPWIQVDEPVLVLDLDERVPAAFERAYEYIAQARKDLKLCLTTYFGSLGDNLEWAMRLPFDAIHMDLVRAPEQLERAIALLSQDARLSLGVVNGRNIWKTNLVATLSLVDRAAAAIGPERLILAPSCSLLHSPVDVESEGTLDPAVQERLAFAKQKLQEVAVLTKAVNEGRTAVADVLDANRAIFDRPQATDRTHNAAVQERLNSLSEEMFRRRMPFPHRKTLQQAALALPLLPTTTIGSFPQTPLIRRTRADFRQGRLTDVEYTQAMRREIESVVRFQEKIGLDVLVHGEPERNDMVEYFGQLLEGFAFTENGWVQSYGSRCVKPPIIYGDVHRPLPMTVEWITYAQSLTDKPVKGMLTGPITILQWSFVREDQPRRDTAYQLALSIRDEVRDLEAAGIRVVQIDEPAIREGLPLRRSERPEYLDWAVKAFRLATCGADDRTQIHTHMCYSDFNEIIEAIAGLDADVISIEASRSGVELLNAFVNYKYPNDIGPGVYDIHSPRVPPTEEMMDLIRRMAEVLSVEQLWVNPDCGLKTRQWPEVEASLRNMVLAARRLREEMASPQQ
ncbi:MAG TPA: 5-methyltetrahydropteroyltriglutamate--homocysteine S-methyltransferase [Sedimentisphaerales bacterium]|nr:5-methyltetrahydropteroyltriglutamate--homocysteine S-methyltransferase [Sedimentisphaerales bacterium]HRS12500.1 5-methyltetrahydropteroyltriglutamate--homocysteine S-methyltransferase [Sedimentisphaerales bacterium]HRV49138.1 5-methyltetrahydropteroyltriglutamate--homocysteine S-methyltransferase [Sedimentisphaerales bacterium]